MALFFWRVTHTWTKLRVHLYCPLIDVVRIWWPGPRMEQNIVGSQKNSLTGQARPTKVSSQIHLVRLSLLHSLRCAAPLVHEPSYLSVQVHTAPCSFTISSSTPPCERLMYSRNRKPLTATGFQRDITPSSPSCFPVQYLLSNHPFWPIENRCYRTNPVVLYGLTPNMGNNEVEERWLRLIQEMQMQSILIVLEVLPACR